MAAGVVVGIGEILWDVFPNGRRLGGAPANFIYQIGQLGGPGFRPRLVSCVGRDEPGRAALAQWERLSLSGEFIATDARHPTGIVAVTVDPQGNPVYEIAESSAWDFLPETQPLRELAATADAVCFGTLAQRSPRSRNTIRNFLLHTRGEALRLLDINLRAPFYSPELAEESLSLANVLKINAAELRTLAELFSLAGGEESVMAGLSERWNLRLVALTKGERGSVLFRREGVSSHKGIPVSMVDSVGAGDAFSAALAVGLLSEFPFERINECANRAAAFVCTQPGAMPEMPDTITDLFR
jgi:fructokinase